MSLMVLFSQIECPRLRVLVIDDDPDDANSLIPTIKNSDCHTSHLSGDDLISTIRRIRPHGVRLDLAIPDEIGFGLIAAMQDDDDMRKLELIARGDWRRAQSGGMEIRWCFFKPVEPETTAEPSGFCSKPVNRQMPLNSMDGPEYETKSNDHALPSC